MTPYVHMVTKSIGHSPIKDQFTVVFFSMTRKLDSLTRPIWGGVIKSLQIREEEINQLVFTVDIMVFMENPKDSKYSNLLFNFRKLMLFPLKLVRKLKSLTYCRYKDFCKAKVLCTKLYLGTVILS